MKCRIAQPSETAVLLVEPAASMRLMITDVLRELGFTRLSFAANGKEVVRILAVEAVDWLIMPLMADSDTNALQILKLISEQPLLRRTCCTLWIDTETEDYCLPAAFELGLLSWHPKTYVRTALLAVFSAFLATVKRAEGDPALIAASFLRGILDEKRLYKSRLALEQNFLTIYPGSPQVLVDLAEAEAHLDGAHRAHLLLAQAELLSPQFAETCKAMRERLALTPGPTPDPENILGLDTVLVIDPDTDIHFFVTQMLRQIGVKTIVVFEQGDQALAWLEANHPPALILMEWRLAGLSGPVLVQRIREGRLFTVPIIVLSSLVKQGERPLLREMGVDELLEKPFDKDDFYRCIVWTVKQACVPTEQRSYEQKIRRFIAAGSWQRAEDLIVQMRADDRIKDVAKRTVEAEFEVAQGHYAGAARLGLAALQQGGDSLALLALIGKCMLKLGQVANALQCFDRAAELSPLNITRLLDIAEARITVGDLAGASKALSVSSAMDPTNPKVAEVACKVALEAGDAAAAIKILDALEAVPRVAGYVNNRAISLALAGRYSEGIKLYQNAIESLPEKWRDVRATIGYNLAIAYARYGEYDTALATLQPWRKDRSVTVFKKAYALAQRIEACVSSGTTLVFQVESGPAAASGAPEPAAKDRDWDHVALQMSSRRGDLGCYLIFQCVEGIDPKATALLKVPLKVALELGKG